MAITHSKRMKYEAKAILITSELSDFTQQTLILVKTYWGHLEY